MVLGDKGWGSSLVVAVAPVEGVAADFGGEQHFVGALVLDAEFVVFLDVDLGKERLVAQAAVGVVAAGVDVGAVGEQEVGVGIDRRDRDVPFRLRPAEHIRSQQHTRSEWP
ncbi:MAG: hypothetical protein ACK5KO_05315 [Arachnia sp.]